MTTQLHMAYGMKYMEGAITRFPTYTRAAVELKKLGRPPSNFDISHPPPQVETAFSSFVAVYTHDNPRRVVDLISIWSSISAPWVEFFIVQVILTDKVPITEEGLDFQINVTNLLHAFIELHQVNGTMDTVKSANPSLLPLVIQVWYKTLDLGYQSWGDWCSLLLVLFHHTTAVPNNLHLDSKYPHPYPQDAALGKIFIRHLASQTRRVADMPMTGIWDLKGFLGVISPLELALIPKGQQHPFCAQGNLIPSLKTVASLIATFFAKRIPPTLSGTERLDNPSIVHDCIKFAFGILYSCWEDHIRIAEVLKTGIVESIFKAPVQYFSPGPQAGRIAEWCVRFIEKVSSFLWYRCVLRTVIRVSKRVDSGPMRSKAPGIWKAWQVMMKKVEVVRGVQAYVKEMRGLCCYDQCPIPDTGEEKTRYLRCLGCCCVFYCSQDCRKLDWKSEHREYCKTLGMKFRNPTGCLEVPRPDLFVFERWIKLFFEQYMADISRMIDEYRLALRKSLNSTPPPKDTKLLVDGTKNPILFIDFRSPGLPTARESVRLVNPDSIFNIENKILDHPEKNRECLEWIVQRWRGAEIRSNSVLIVGSFPGTNERPCSKVIALPLGETDDIALLAEMLS